MLAALALVAGFVETPRLLGHVTLFSTFLQPVLASGAADLAAGRRGARAAAARGWRPRWAASARRMCCSCDTERLVDALARVGARSRARRRWWDAGWGFDGLYERVLVRPCAALARANRDRLVDRFYAGVAGTVRAGAPGGERDRERAAPPVRRRRGGGRGDPHRHRGLADDPGLADRDPAARRAARLAGGASRRSASGDGASRWRRWWPTSCSRSGCGGCAGAAAGEPGGLDRRLSARPWIPRFGIGFHLAIDGLSLLLVLLTLAAGARGVACSWSRDPTTGWGSSTSTCCGRSPARSACSWHSTCSCSSSSGS